MNEFFVMGGYAAYVWPAYGLAGVVLGGLTLQSLWAGLTARRRLAAATDDHEGEGAANGGSGP